MKMITLPLLALLLIAPAQETQSPSLEETTSWIKQQFESYGKHIQDTQKSYNGRTYDERNSYVITDAEFKECSLTFNYAKSQTPGLRYVQKPFITLGDLDADKIKTEEKLGCSWVVLPALEGKTIRVENYMGASSRGPMVATQSTSEKSVEIPVTDKDIAERMAKAFKHAASLCRNKKQPF